MCKRARPSKELGYAVLEAGVLQAYAPTTRWWLVADLIWHTPAADLIWEKSTTACLRKAPLLVAIRIEWSSMSPLWNLRPCDPAPEEDGYTIFGKRSARLFNHGSSFIQIKHNGEASSVIPTVALHLQDLLRPVNVVRLPENQSSVRILLFNSVLNYISDIMCFILVW